MFVSIPIGFSSSLQHGEVGVLENSGFVSIPIGFSSSLQHDTVKSTIAWLDEFQSLSGFQVRCNIEVFPPCVLHILEFQSLSGFQVRCNVCLGLGTLPKLYVSIPIGFSSSLQRSHTHRQS